MEWNRSWVQSEGVGVVNGSGTATGSRVSGSGSGVAAGCRNEGVGVVCQLGLECVGVRVVCQLGLECVGMSDGIRNGNSLVQK